MYIQQPSVYVDDLSCLQVALSSSSFDYATINFECYGAVIRYQDLDVVKNDYELSLLVIDQPQLLRYRQELWSTYTSMAQSF